MLVAWALVFWTSCSEDNVTDAASKTASKSLSKARNFVITDFISVPNQSKISKAEIIDLLEEHLRFNLLHLPPYYTQGKDDDGNSKFDPFHTQKDISGSFEGVHHGGEDQRNIFRQALGIPQGSVVSSLLCHLYYGALELKMIHEYGLPDPKIWSHSKYEKGRKRSQNVRFECSLQLRGFCGSWPGSAP